MARYSDLSKDTAPAPDHYVGRKCTVCHEPFEKGQQVRDLYVYKVGYLDWIEEQHDVCPNGSERNPWQSGTMIKFGKEG